MPQTNYPHIASMIFNTPLMCTTQIRDAVQQAVLPRLFSENNTTIVLGNNSEKELLSPRYEKQDARNIESKTYAGIAIIPVHGILTTRRGNITADCSEIASYEKIGSLIDTAVNDSKVEEIILDINSGGGAAVGCFDMAEKIFEARHHKKITAIINYSAYSAAYMIASAATEIIVSTTSGAGSIGVIASHVDLSSAMDAAGLKITNFYRGHHKNDLSPYEAVSDDARAELDAELDSLYNLFVEKVARNRGLSTQAVIDTQARTYRGQEAIQTGLADQLMYPQDAVNAIASVVTARIAKQKTVGLNARNRRASVMKMEAQH